MNKNEKLEKAPDDMTKDEIWTLLKYKEHEVFTLNVQFHRLLNLFNLYFKSEIYYD